MEFLKFDAQKCILCGKCVDKCPFGALRIEHNGIEVGEGCRMCGLCVRHCPEHAIRFEQKAATVDKESWRDFLIYVEQEQGEIHPVAFELIGEARKMAQKVGYKVNCVLVGAEGTAENGEKLLPYGVDNVYVYEHSGFAGFRADCYTDAVADCIAAVRPSSVLIGATALGRSLAPRLSTRFHTGLTADCTTLDIKPNSDMIQIRPAFGGNIMAQIAIAKSRPQFATVRYRVMDRAERVAHPTGRVVRCTVSDEMTYSGIRILSSEVIERQKSLEEEEVIVVAGRGVRSEKDVEMCRELAEALGGQLAFTRPMVENGFGDTAHQIGLSGRTVRPKLIITCGVSGAIQFTSCMNGSECIVAINSDPEAQIFKVAHYCVVDDLYRVVPEMTELVRSRMCFEKEKAGDRKEPNSESTEKGGR
ncbi:MAG: electron transfer flavoprotein subunit alpha [Candidatus Choladocola sp.]|nr:electron transfer flavoprotein subunit alpha [Candidatus Choladocola sp.]